MIADMQAPTRALNKLHSGANEGLLIQLLGNRPALL